MNWPTVSVNIPTFNRPDILSRTINLLKENLHYSGEIHYRVGNDGDRLDDLHPDIEIISGPRRGLGANLNKLIMTTETDIMMQMDDDHWLIQPMALDRHIARLRDDTRAGWIRLMGIAAHEYTADLIDDYWYVRWDSKFTYIPSNRPHLKHRRFHEFFGLYPSGLKLGQTEESFCLGCKDIAARYGYGPAPRVLVPLDCLTESSWQHVGESWQHKGY